MADSARVRRTRQLLRFRQCQRGRRQWIGFWDIADWLARERGTADRRNEDLCRQGYGYLRDGILDGEFERQGKSLVLYIPPIPDLERRWGRLRLTRERLRKQEEYYLGYPDAVITGVLPHCWVPSGLARRWFERRGMAWPADFDPARSDSSPVSAGSNAESAGSIGCQKVRKRKRQRAAYMGALAQWMAPQHLDSLRRMRSKDIAANFKAYCEAERPDLLAQLPKRPRSMGGVIERIIADRVERGRTEAARKAAAKGQ